MSARALADRILAGDLAGPCTAREVYRQHWAGLPTREDAQKGIDVLVELGWLAESREETGGRPSLKYVVNPAVGRGTDGVA